MSPDEFESCLETTNLVNKETDVPATSALFTFTMCLLGDSSEMFTSLFLWIPEVTVPSLCRFDTFMSSLPSVTITDGRKSQTCSLSSVQNSPERVQIYLTRLAPEIERDYKRWDEVTSICHQYSGSHSTQTCSDLTNTDRRTSISPQWLLVKYKAKNECGEQPWSFEEKRMSSYWNVSSFERMRHRWDLLETREIAGVSHLFFYLIGRLQSHKHISFHILTVFTFSLIL